MAQIHKFRKTKSLFSTTLSVGIGTGTSETITLSSTVGLPTDTEITLTFDRVDADGIATPAKIERITGVISSSTFTNYTRGIDSSTDQVHSAGAVIEYIWNADDWNDAVDGILVEHGQDGAHTSTLITSLKATGAVVNTGASDVTIVTPKAIADSYLGGATSNLQTQISNNPNSLSRQAIINGNFDITQRFGVTATDQSGDGVFYYLDRWQVSQQDDGGTNPTNTYSQQIQTPGDLANSYFFWRIAPNGAGSSLGNSSKGNTSQKIENGTRLLCGDGKKVTVSFLARASVVSKRIAVGLVQNYGTGGSPTTEEPIKGEVFTLTSSWAKYTYTFTTNTLSGKTFGTSGGDYLQLILGYQWGTTWGDTYYKTSVTAETYGGSGTIDIAQVQLCAGDVALPFMPKSYSQELQDCYRYYQRQTSLSASEIIGSGSAYTTADTQIIVNLMVEMRVKPTLEVSNGTHFIVSDLVGSADTTGVSANANSSSKVVLLSVSVASGLTQFRRYTLNFDATAGAYIAFTSEF